MKSVWLRYVWLLTGILMLCVTVFFGYGQTELSENPSKTETNSEKHSETASGTAPVTPEEPDAPYELVYTSNGDGTCSVSSVRFRTDCQEPLTLVFPETSPGGERVISVDYPVSRVIPQVIAKEDFTRHIAEPLAELLGADSFYYKRFMTYFELRDPAKEDSEQAREAMFLQYPLTRATPVYVLVSDASPSELTK